MIDRFLKNPNLNEFEKIESIKQRAEFVEKRA